MANITLSAAGNDATSNERKERKTLVNAVRKYEDTHHLNSGSVCSVEEAGVAFLQTYATSTCASNEEDEEGHGEVAK
jgi:hypothetical protein